MKSRENKHAKMHVGLQEGLTSQGPGGGRNRYFLVVSLTWVPVLIRHDGPFKVLPSQQL